MKKNYVSIFTAVIIFLTLVNIALSGLAMWANRAAAKAYEERHAIISAIYESSIAGGTFTRLARYHAVAGCDLTYEHFFYELSLDRYGQTLETFTAFGANEQEVELFSNVTELRKEMLDIHLEVLRLRQAGYVQEAIDLAHGPELQAIGIPAGPMSDEVRNSVYGRTTEAALANRHIAEISGILIIVTSSLQILGGVIVLFFVGKTGMSRRVEIFGAAILVLACLTLVSSVLSGTYAGEKLDTYEQQYALVNASYNAERGGEILTRMSRMFVITGNEAQYDSYQAELKLDRVGHAFEAYILMNAESSEINMLIDILGRLNRLRQIEEQSMLLRAAGHYQQAIDVAFGADVVELDKPLALLGEELREAVNDRTRGIIDDAAYRHGLFAAASMIALILLTATGVGKLFAVKHARKEAAPGIVARIYGRIEHAAIRTKLFASFSIVIILFTVQVGIDAYFDNQVDRLTHHDINYLMERSDGLWAFHQEFTEMRRLLRASFLSSSWLETSTEAEWLLAERSLSASHARLSYLKRAYETSVLADPIFIATPEDSRIVIMEEVMSHIDMIYAVYRENFFLSGNMSLDPGDVMDFTGPAESFLQFMRYFVDVTRELAEERILELHNRSTVVSLVSLVAAFAFAFLLAFSMLRSFTGRIKMIEDSADKVAQGDFESYLQGGSDEITTAYLKLFEVFTSLINEINYVTDESRKGNMDARIDTSHFQGTHEATAFAINTLLDAAEEMLRQKELSQVAQKANEEKGKFLARMSHEIRTPITAVLGISEICLRGSTLSHDIKEAFSKIYDSARILLNIVNDILDFSKIEAGKMDIADREYDVANLIGHIAGLQTVYLEHKTVDFQIHVDKQLPTHLIGDTLRIRQIMNNLISNSFKYTESGSVSLSFLRGKEDGDYVTLVIVICDTGFGMNENQLEAVKTSEFSRFHETGENYTSGSGLGIPIVYSLAQMMNGQVEFVSEVGKGTTVHISIPQKKCTEEILGEEAAANLQDYQSHSQQFAEKFRFVPEPMPYGKVLVVDDVDANLFVARGLLNFYGISVETCTNGQDAIRKIEQGAVYDIVFMDILMPEQSGTVTMQIMREKGYNHPIVALTANALVGQAEEFTKIGFDDFVSKPIQSMQLNDVLLKFIRDKQPPEVIAEAKAKANLHIRELPGDSSVDEKQGGIDSFMSDVSVVEKLRVAFARSNKNAFSAITQALNTGSIETAHRIAHTIKSSAAMINENSLAEIAKDVEHSLRDKKTLTGAQLSALENELTQVLNHIKASESTHDISGMTEDDLGELLGELEPLLKTHNAKCLQLVGQLHNVPEAAILVRQIEEFDFEAAEKSMETLKQIYEN